MWISWQRLFDDSFMFAGVAEKNSAVVGLVRFCMLDDVIIEVW
jgi:hypothetical protein